MDLVNRKFDMRSGIDNLQHEISKLEQFQPDTKHYFHAGMYCREVFRPAGVLVVGAVHKKEHFYLIVQGTVLITDGMKEANEVTGPILIKSMPGTKRAVYSVTDALCMTFHVCDSVTVEDAEKELVEEDLSKMYSAGNLIDNAKKEVIR